MSTRDLGEGKGICCPTCEEAPRTLRGDLRVAALLIVIEDNNRLKTALAKIDAIRNSIIGAQTVNWSEHIYPLVAALSEAGYAGQPYETARENVKTLIEIDELAWAYVDAVEATAELAPEALEAYAELRQALERRRATPRVGETKEGT